MLGPLKLAFDLMVRSCSSRSDLLLENLALRQRLAVPKRRHPEPRIAAHDKMFWTILRRLWAEWRRALILVQPETVVRWHRAGFKLYWTWFSRHRNRAKKAREPRIAWADLPHGRREPDLGRAAHSRRVEDAGLRYFGTVRAALDAASSQESQPARRWAAFLNNHRQAIAAMDFFTVPAFTVYDRTHLALAKGTPAGRRAAKNPGVFRRISSMPKLGGLHHRYDLAA